MERNHSNMGFGGTTLVVLGDCSWFQRQPYIICKRSLNNRSILQMKVYLIVLIHLRTSKNYLNEGITLTQSENGDQSNIFI